ncbi:MAG: NHL/RHS/YD repeat protein [Candidatus Woesebacteria bacterium GW2011_GWB1_39_12]|uniref:NHL/RHS/YD repeat protein n=2 Tax=Candidatus Woeseibacteriota TaxID=1752722 RepID=A0A0G0Q7I4_9BACT|nr:MAG: NHL/RHS/YD repeat protein [Candidatus Woesebacteria bacterium GW2011_GWA1_39_12]KKR01159.1 MAG: NHL/RHS/YD repeat protein [Candidatus Woesebacteria bacterium GW2011_GWB1_39_12]
MKLKSCPELVVYVVCIVFIVSGFWGYASIVAEVNAQAPANSVNFLYDGSGQRIAKIEAGGEHTYYISPNLEIVVKPDGTYSFRKNYYFNGKQVAVRDNSEGTEQLSYIHQDHLGSTNLVTSEQGTVVSQQVYFPYGSTRTVHGSLSTEHQYTSQVSDADSTGLYYYNARYYNPQLAKFTQADTANDNQNRYSYVNNNPASYIDPLGTTRCYMLNTPDPRNGECFGETQDSLERYTDSNNPYTPNSNEPYIAQETPNSCGSAIIAMIQASYLEDSNQNTNISTLYKEALNYFNLKGNDYKVNNQEIIDYLGNAGIETQLLRDSNNRFINYPDDPNYFYDLVNRYGGNLITDINSYYLPPEEGFTPNHWVIVDGVVEINGVHYVRLRDPLRSGDPSFNSLKNIIPNRTIPYTNGSILVEWKTFYKTRGSILMGIRQNNSQPIINRIKSPNRNKNRGVQAI